MSSPPGAYDLSTPWAPTGVEAGATGRDLAEEYSHDAAVTTQPGVTRVNLNAAAGPDCRAVACQWDRTSARQPEAEAWARID